ncbi:MAG: alpha/beta fold hydrolase [Hyphomicrobiales bacterium]|nr:alpha/beta fold hydrolase [Hyphomicrobiales bacterium]
MPLAHTAYGSGPDVIVLHGLFGSARNWAGVAKALSAHHRVHALDLRNHGDSFWADGMAYADMADDLRRFMADRHLGGAAVIGHSMGGKAAMVLALHDPHLVGRLLVADVAPAGYGHSFADYVAAMAAVDLAGIDRRAQVDAQLAAAIPEDGLRAFLLQNLVRGPGGLRWRVNLDALAAHMAAIGDFPDIRPGQAYRGPTLFLAGGRSDYIEPHHHGLIHRLFPHARIAVLPGAGHWLHAEQPRAFVAAARDFLAA